MRDNSTSTNTVTSTVSSSGTQVPETICLILRPRSEERAPENFNNTNSGNASFNISAAYRDPNVHSEHVAEGQTGTIMTFPETPITALEQAGGFTTQLITQATLSSTALIQRYENLTPNASAVLNIEAHVNFLRAAQQGVVRLSQRVFENRLHLETLRQIPYRQGEFVYNTARIIVPQQVVTTAASVPFFIFFQIFDLETLNFFLLYLNSEGVNTAQNFVQFFIYFRPIFLTIVSPDTWSLPATSLSFAVLLSLRETIRLIRIAPNISVGPTAIERIQAADTASRNIRTEAERVGVNSINTLQWWSRITRSISLATSTAGLSALLIVGLRYGPALLPLVRPILRVLAQPITNPAVPAEGSPGLGRVVSGLDLHSCLEFFRNMFM